MVACVLCVSDWLGVCMQERGVLATRHGKNSNREKGESKQTTIREDTQELPSYSLKLKRSLKMLFFVLHYWRTLYLYLVINKCSSV